MAHRPDSLVIRSRVEDVRQAAQRNAFINALAMVGTVSVAAKIVGLNPKTLYAWRKEDEEFKESWDNALTLAFEGLESATYLKLARVLQDATKRISMPEAKLIEMFLAGHKPDKYRQRTIEIDNSQNVMMTIDWSQVPDAIMAEFVNGRLTLNDVYQATLLVRMDQPSDQEEKT